MAFSVHELNVTVRVVCQSGTVNKLNYAKDKRRERGLRKRKSHACKKEKSTCRLVKAMAIRKHPSQSRRYAGNK